MRTYILIAGLLLTLTLSVAPLLQGCGKPANADFTVNKTMSEAFQMLNPDGSPRTNCAAANFKVKVWRNNTSLGYQTWTFRNQSTGDYTASRVPTAPGFHKMIYYYNNTTFMVATENVRLYDIDTMYASSGPRFADISANLSGAATAFVAVRTVVNNMTSFVHATNTKVAVIPSNPLLTNDTRLNKLDAYISAIPTSPLLSTDSRLNNLDIAISSRMSAGNWIAELPTFNNLSAGVHGLRNTVQSIPTNPLLANDTRLNNLDAQVSSRASQASLNNLPSASSIASTVWGNGARTLTSNAYVNSTSIDLYLSSKHGTGAWDAAGNVTVLPFQGAASYETVAQGKDVHVTRGDSVAIPYSIGKDLTGWTVWFGAKATPEDGTFAILPRDITTYVTDPSTGSGLISLSTADTGLPVRKYAAEVEIRNGTDVNTVLKFNLLIDAGVIN
ncbi:MAG: hypothetical protein WA666_07260 [Nitrospirota bacterium]